MPDFFRCPSLGDEFGYIRAGYGKTSLPSLGSKFSSILYSAITEGTSFTIWMIYIIIYRPDCGIKSRPIWRL